jgi:hypothetical protein
MAQTAEERKRESDRKYREAHKEQIRVYNRKYRETHLEQQRETHKKYYESHKDEARACSQKWDKEHVEQKRETARNWCAANPEKVRNYYIKHRYGLTDGGKQLLIEQGGVCALCGNNPPKGEVLAVDHDHATGKVCALLCSKCNRGLGCFNDDPTLLRKATEYAEKTRTNTS